MLVDGKSVCVVYNRSHDQGQQELKRTKQVLLQHLRFIAKIYILRDMYRNYRIENLLFEIQTKNKFKNGEN